MGGPVSTDTYTYMYIYITYIYITYIYIYIYERSSKFLIRAVVVLQRVSLFNVPHRFTGIWHKPNVILNLGCHFTRFSFSGNTTLVLERPSPAAGWIFFILW